MYGLLLVAFVFAMFTKLFRCIVFNLHNVGIYTVIDLYRYFRYKEYKKFNEFGITMFCGMFGKGKTLSMVNKANSLYDRYGDSLVFYSNFKLNGIPYIPLVNFNQLVDLGKDMPDSVQGYVVLIDEISSVLSHRNFANFPLELIGLLCQQRKRHVVIYCSAQRYFMVDKIFRSITNYVVDCSKHWRFIHNVYYDAWDYENAMNTLLVRRLDHLWWFAKDRLFDSYDTSEMISKTSAKDFISNEEAIVRKGLDAQVNLDAVKKPSKVLKKRRSA